MNNREPWAEEREVLRRRAASDDAIAAQARASLRDALERRRPDALPPTLDSLARALVLAAEASGAKVSEERVGALMRRPEPSDVFAAAARLRIPVRPVELSGDWWREHGLPLVAISDDGSAHALVAGRRGYRIAGEHSATDRDLTAELAAGLGSKAWVVTPRLPDGPSSWRDLARAATAGAGRGDAVRLVGASAALMLLGLVLPLTTTWIVGEVIPEAESSSLAAPAVALGAVVVALLACTVLQGLVVVRAVGRADAAAQAAILDRVFHLPTAFLRSRSSGRLAREVLAVDEIRSLISSAVVAGLAAAGLGLASVVLIVLIAPKLGAAPALVVLVGGMLALAQSRRRLAAQRVMLAERSRLNGVLVGMLGGIAKLRVAAAEERMTALWARGYARQQAAQRRAADANANIAVIFVCLSAAATFAIVVAAETIASGIDTARFVGVSTALAQLTAATTLMVPALSQLLEAIPLYETARPVLQARVEVSGRSADPGELSGDVELAGVRFGYGDDQPPALDNVSLRASAGEFVAIAGPSGAGKSTIVRLLLGFEDPQRGSVLYDGRDLGSVDVEAVRRQIGVVMQSAVLNSGSILQNIVGVLPYTEQDAWAAADLAGVGADIRAMPMGMQTIVTDGGSSFSGGQRQRLMIARALLRRPRLLIFDEATSALDNETQAIVTDSLSQLGATRIVIAHRLSTIEHADRIYVLESGRVVEHGSYAELAAAGGPFSRLAQRQLVS
jgi:NHLM bacteriocin system ABC transporter ATP-binding protein